MNKDISNFRSFANLVDEDELKGLGDTYYNWIYRNEYYDQDDGNNNPINEKYSRIRTGKEPACFEDVEEVEKPDFGERGEEPIEFDNKW